MRLYVTHFATLSPMLQIRRMMRSSSSSGQSGGKPHRNRRPRYGEWTGNHPCHARSSEPVLPANEVIGMARTHGAKLVAAEAIAERLANRDLDKTRWQEPEPLRRIAEAFGEQVTAEAKVAEAVSAARAAGCSWLSIGMMLGVSKQTAQQRYGAMAATAVAAAPPPRARSAGR